MDLPAIAQPQKHVRLEADPGSVVLQDTKVQVPRRSANEVTRSRSLLGR